MLLLEESIRTRTMQYCHRILRKIIFHGPTDPIYRKIPIISPLSRDSIVLPIVLGQKRPLK